MENSKNYKNCTMFLSDDDDDDDDDDNMCFVEKDNQFVEVKQNNVKSNENYSANCSTPSESKLSEPTSSESKLSEPTSSESKMTPLCEQLTYEMCGGSIAELVKTRKRSCKNMSFEVETPQMQVPDKRVRKNSKDSDSLLNKTSEEKSIKPLRGKQIQKVKKKLIKSTMFSNNERFNQENDAGENSSVRQGDQSLSIQTVTSKGKVPSSVDVTKDSSSDLPRNETNVTGERWGVKISRENEQFFCKSTVYNDLSHSTLVVQKLTVGRTKKSSKKTKTNDNNRAHTDITSTMPSIQNSAVKSVRPSNARKTIKGIEKRTDVSSQLIGNTLNVDLPNCTTNQVSKDTVKTTVHFQPQLESNTSKDINKKTSHSNARKTIKGLDKYPSFPSKPISSIQNQNSSSEFSSTQTSKLDQVKISARKDFSIDVLSDDDIEIIHVSTDNKNCDGNSSKSCFQSKDKSALLQSAINNDKSISKETSLEVITHSHINARKSINILRKPSNISRLRSIPNIQSHYNLDENVSSENSEVTQAKATTSKEVSNSISSGEDEIQIIDIIRIKEPANNSLGTIPSKNFSCTKEKSKDHDKSIGVPSEPLNIENRCCEKRAVAQKPKKITQTKTLSNEMQDSAALSFEDGEKELEIIDERIKGKISSNIPMQNILNVNQNLVPLQPEVASKTSKKLRSNQRNSKGKKAVKGVDENSNLLCASTSNSKNEIYLKETISAQDSKATHVITPSSNIIPFNNQKEVDNVHPKNCHSNSKVDENISQLNLFVVEQSNVTNRTARKKSTSHILRAKKRFTNSSKYLSTQCPSNSEESCDSDATTIAPAFNLNQSGTGNAASTFNDEIESDEDNSVNSKIIDCIATLDEDISVAQPGLLVDGDKLNETEKISNSKARKTFRAAESNIPSKLVDRNHENASPNTQDFKFKKAKLSSLKRNNKKKHEVINEVGEARKFDAAHNVPSLNPSDVSNNKKSNKTCGESKKRVSQKKAKEFDVYENFIRELSIDNSNSSESSVTVTAQKTKLNKAKRVCGKATKSNPERNRKNKDVNKLQITEACDTRLDEKVLGIQMEATSCLQQTDIKGPANKMSQTKKRNIPKAKKRLKEMNKHTGDTVNSDLIKEKRDFDPLPATQLLKSNSIVNDSNNKTDINLESVLLIAQKINKDSGKETKSVHNSVNSQNKNENRDIESYLYNSDQSNDNPSTSIESKLLQNRAKPHNELIKSVPALHKEIVDVFKPNTARKSSTVSMCRPQNISIESLDFKVLSDKMLTTDISKSIRRVEKIIEKNDDVENFLYNSKLEKEHHRNPKVAIATPGFDVNQRPSNVLENKNSTNIKIETINLDEDEEAQTHRMVVNDLQHTLANKPKSIPFLGTVNSNPNAIKQELADMTVSHEKPSKGLFNSEWAPVFATNDNLLIKSEEKQAYVCESNKIPLRRESSTDSVKQIEPTFSTLYDSDSNEENKTDDVITPANMCEPISSSESNYSESVEKCEVSSEKQFKISFNPINSGKWNSVQDSLDSPSLSKFDQDIAEEKPFDSSISTQELVSILNTATACIVIPNRYQHNDLQRDVTTSELFCNKPKTFQSTICASKSSKTECADLKEQKLLECAKQCVVKVMQASISPSSENVHNIDAREQISAHATIDIFSDKVSFHAEQQHLVSNPGDVKNLKYLPSSSLTITDLQKSETLNRNKDLKNESELPKRYSKESFCLKSESFSSDISSEASKACLRCTDKWKCHKHSWSSVAEKAYSRRSRSREKRKRHSWSHSQSKNVSPGCKSNEKQTAFFSETRNAEPRSVSRLSNSSKNDGVISPPLSNEHKPSNRSRSRERKHHELSCAQKRSSSQGKTASNEKESTSAESTRSSDKTSKFPIRERRGPSSNTVQKHNLSRSRSRSGSPKIDICKEKETDRKAPDNSKSLLAENEKHRLSRSHSKDRKYYKPSGSRHISPTRSPSRDSRFTESSRNQNKDYRSRRRSLSRSRDCRSRWRPRSRSRNYEHRKRSRSRSGDSSSHKRSRSRSRDYRTYKRSRSRSRDRRHNRRSRSRNRSSSPINKTSAERCDSISKTIDSKDCSQLDNISESSKNSKSNLTSRKRHDSKSRSKERKHRRLTCPRNKERKSQELSRSRSRSFSPRNKTRDDKCSSPSKAVTLDSSNLSDITSSSESWTSENSKKKYFDNLLSEKRKSRSHSRSRSRSSSSRSRSRSSSSRVNLDESHSWSQIIHEPNQRRVIYLNGIPDSYTDDELSYRFSRFGYIEDVHIVKRQFCRDNNYGFLTYRNTQDAVKAIKHGNDPPFEPKFSITFGDRRSFLQNKVYVDLDKAEEKKRPMNFSDNNSSVPEETEFDVALNAALQRAGLPLRKLVSEKPDESLVFSEPNVP